jgi:hypothetical protein
MLLYLGPSCPNHPSSEDLSAVEINTQIHRVLDLGANPNPGASPALFQEWVANTRVSTCGLVSVAYVILSFHRTHGLA